METLSTIERAVEKTRPQAVKKKHYPARMNLKNCDQLDTWREKNKRLTGLSDDAFAEAISMHTIKLC